jgi:hypothetical protein
MSCFGDNFILILYISDVIFCRIDALTAMKMVLIDCVSLSVHGISHLPYEVRGPLTLIVKVF